MERQIENQLPKDEREEAIAQFKKEFQLTVDEFSNRTIKPYERFIPLAVAAIFFMPLIAVTRLLSWIPALLLRIIFFLLRALKVIKITTETREVQRLTIS